MLELTAQKQAFRNGCDAAEPRLERRWSNWKMVLISFDRSLTNRAQDAQIAVISQTRSAVRQRPLRPLYWSCVTC
jgi:hypothetical protein